MKLIKENWLIAVISSAVGSIITLFFIFILPVRTWDSNSWSAFFNFFGALGTISIGIGALWFANVQAKTSDNAYQYQISQRYMDSYNNLVMLFENAHQLFSEQKYIKQLHNDDLKEYVSVKLQEILNLSSKIKNEAFLLFPNNSDLIELTQNIYNEIYDISQARNNSIMSKFLLEQATDKNRSQFETARDHSFEKALDLQMKFISKYMKTGDKYSYIGELSNVYQRYLKI